MRVRYIKKTEQEEAVVSRETPTEAGPTGSLLHREGRHGRRGPGGPGDEPRDGGIHMWHGQSPRASRAGESFFLGLFLR